MNQKTIKKLCKILKVIGYFFVFGGGVVFSVSARAGVEIIIKLSSLVFFVGGLLQIPQDILNKKRWDKLDDFSFQRLVPSIRLCAALLFSLYLVIMAWTHDW
ncbi:MAG: hypothetical protein NC548_56275 [Lachnospiraceae bacterium]|nr:hypothetical protein [Lachnospiraceae bacterium]